MNCSILAQFQIVLLIFISISAKSQVEISGVIKNSKTDKPIPHVEVFISGTTVGCISNENGEYSLSLPYIPCTLIADHVSFGSYVKNLKGNEKVLNIKLKPEINKLHEITVTSKNKRKKNLKFFYARFVRKNKNKIEILNDSVLQFKVTENEFVAFTKEPLIIINKILGYKIKVRMQGFRVYRSLTPGGRRLPLHDLMGMEYAQLSGYFYYEPLMSSSAKELLEYKNNRLLYYFGSDRHFFKSLYDQKLTENGFEIKAYTNHDPSSVISEVKNYDPGFGGKNYSLLADSIMVIYRFGQNRYPKPYFAQNKLKRIYAEESKIYGSPDIFTLWQNGTSPDLKLTIIGPLAPGTNFVNTLPKDFTPL